MKRAVSSNDVRTPVLWMPLLLLSRYPDQFKHSLGYRFGLPTVSKTNSHFSIGFERGQGSRKALDIVLVMTQSCKLDPLAIHDFTVLFIATA